MVNLLRRLSLGLQSLGWGNTKCKSKVNDVIRLSQWSAQVEQTETELASGTTSTGLSEQHLQQILQQVRAEGFYVESLTIFRYGNLKPGESISAIERWAAEVGLKVSFNHEHQLCFFEKG